ncbi:Tigger transposable element-derived protein 4 [Dictyocoela muelleri]|nr:Tigger transposable element-derived protein 4 [Dictyocoela muelleri]
MAGEKLGPLVIRKSKQPRFFAKRNIDTLNIDYKYNKKSWMTALIFKEWLEALNYKMIIKNRKIHLTLDNAPIHTIDMNYSNIELFYFPPNVTSEIQHVIKEL